MTEYDVTVELFVDGAWLDITRIDDDTRVLGEVTITRGGSDQQGESTSTEVKFKYLDNNLTLDPENPYSAYYRKIAIPGTRLRVKLDGEIRASVELVAAPIEPGEVPEINYLNFEAAGKLRSLEQGQKPLRSAAYRAFTSAANDAYRVAYWPFEEESNATVATSPTPGASVAFGGPGTVNFGALESMSSDRLATFGSFDTFLTFVLPPWTNSLSQHFAGSIVRWPQGGLLDNAIIWRFYFTGGTVDYIDLLHNTGDILSLVAYSGGASVGTQCLSDWTGILDDREAFLFCTFEQSGADINVRIRATTATSWLLQVTGTFVGRTCGRMYQMVMGTGAGTENLGFGHVIVGSNKDAFGSFIDDLDEGTSLVTGARGYEFERAGRRMLRLAEEEDIAFTIDGDDYDTEKLATQESETFLELVRSAAGADLGMLCEARDAFELTYITRTGLYNKVPTAELDFAHILPGFRPTSDDLRVVNDVTVSRPGGGSAHYAIPDGDFFHYSTEQPPDGIGIRDDAPSVLVSSDDQLNEQAAWRAHLGSWRERRFSSIPMEVAKPVFDADDVTAVRALDIGHVLTFDMTGAPRYAPYNEIRLLVQGYTEVLSRKLHTITFNTTPADIYEVAQVDSGPTSTLAAPISAVTNSIRISPGTGPAWSESSSDLPYHVQVAGQPMTATSVTTDSPAFVAAGVVAVGSNASVTPALPAGITPDVAQLLLVWATIRNSGTGTVNTPTGWTKIVDYGNTALLGKHYVTGDAAPLVTFTGGVANATTMARMFAFSALSMSLASGTKAVPAAHTQLNGSAQNIDYPALTVNRSGSVALIFAWKQDDWTSVAPPAGFTEMSDDASVTGDDAGIWAGYDLTAASAAAGSLVVTGGAAAISRAVVLALRPLQSADVTRGIAGVATSASVGAEIHGWRMGVAGL
jgi:hypothetical protein